MYSKPRLPASDDSDDDSENDNEGLADMTFGYTGSDTHASRILQKTRICYVSFLSRMFR